MSNRSRRRANDLRRTLAALFQRPLPLKEQQERAAERETAHKKRYPYPPVYRNAF